MRRSARHVASAPLLAVGGRLACYCPVTSQVEAAWDACERAGLDVEWAGELIERQWGRASKGGMRPVNGNAAQHTAFLLVAQRRTRRSEPSDPAPEDSTPSTGEDSTGTMPSETPPGRTGWFGWNL